MKDVRNLIEKVLGESLVLKRRLAEDEFLVLALEKVARWLEASLMKGGHIWWCGNGGSASDAQHLAAELSGRFYLDRKALRSDALHVNGSYITAVSNDYGFDEVYERLVDGWCRQEDVLMAMSTSGNSENVIRACRRAKEMGVKVVGMTGLSGGELESVCDLCLKMPSSVVPRIQEGHMLVGHILCELVEESMFGRAR